MLFDLQREALRPSVAALATAESWARSPVYPLSRTPIGRFQAALFESTARLIKSYPKRDWAFPDVIIDGEDYPVRKTTTLRKPFANLLRFKRVDLPDDAPKVLFLAALSGHHATLSKETYEQFLPDHEVFVSDWLDARQVPLAEGPFGFDEYVSYVIEFLETLGPQTHVFAICQAAVPALVAAAVMSRDGNPCRPHSLAMMAGPVDIRVNPNGLLQRAQRLDLNQIKKAAIYKVPSRFPGAGRRVYPGAVQLMGFMSMNVRLHLSKHLQFFKDVVLGREEQADRHRAFYDEYFSLLDTAAEFYLETLERVFIDQQLPKGTMRYQGDLVRCSDITDIPMLTLEGAEDDMVSVGQTAAALDLAANLPAKLKTAYVQKHVGHYGIFQGRYYRNETAPRVKRFIAEHGQPRAN
ncbi:MAG: polyhydroxyalkanoate depolymerase [Salinisphaera sp.]|nr:polyhydroxyalkanoate depolymerase [Salinisphaera sp.]